MNDQHWLTTLRNILKTHQGTPQSVIFFLSGNLPGKAQLHLKQLSIFSIITRLPSDPLHKRAKHVLTSGFSSCKSWLFQVRDICVLYNLPHPLQLLSSKQPHSSGPVQETYQIQSNLLLGDKTKTRGSIITILNLLQTPILLSFNPTPSFVDPRAKFS